MDDHVPPPVPRILRFKCYILDFFIFFSIWAVVLHFDHFYEPKIPDRNTTSNTPDQNRGLIDGAYFSITTVTFVGFGDLVPKNKALAVFLILVCFYYGAPVTGRFFDLVGHYLLDYFFHTEATRWRVKVFGALLSVPILIGVGGLGIHFLDRDKNGLRRAIGASYYLAVSSISSVGFGDDHFKTSRGRLFAVVWLFLGVTIAFKSISLLFSEFNAWRFNYFPVMWNEICQWSYECWINRVGPPRQPRQPRQPRPSRLPAQQLSTLNTTVGLEAQSIHNRFNYFPVMWNEFCQWSYQCWINRVGPPRQPQPPRPSPPSRLPAQQLSTLNTTVGLEAQSIHNRFNNFPVMWNEFCQWSYQCWINRVGLPRPPQPPRLRALQLLTLNTTTDLEAPPIQNMSNSSGSVPKVISTQLLPNKAINASKPQEPLQCCSSRRSFTTEQLEKSPSHRTATPSSEATASSSSGSVPGALASSSSGSVLEAPASSSSTAGNECVVLASCACGMCTPIEEL